MMGYIRHHAIVITTWKEHLIEKARAKAVKLFGKEQVSRVIKSPMNGYKTVFIAPDGSKEGWYESEEGDDNRLKMEQWVKLQKYEDGSSPIDLAHIQYGDDEGDNRIIQST